MATQTFNYTGAAQTFTWPAGVSSATVDLRGGTGQGYNASTSGACGRVVGTINKGAESTIQVNVGGGLGNTFNGGGVSTSGMGGSGGGASDIRVGGTALANRIIVAGGGGAEDGSGNFSGGGVGGGGTPTAAYAPGNGQTNTGGGAGGAANFVIVSSPYSGVNRVAQAGGSGAVRIVWCKGGARGTPSFPSTNVGA